ncbi:MAG: hypothetical protein KJO81_04695 [Gammaproteobacteria bacterium]|nr:hypothetical protein [Gammaproteobacteria bacterium]
MAHQIQKISNPQGKGVVGIIEDLRACTPMLVEAKSNYQWLADYFTSTLVLSAKYGFKPVIGKDYYLYYKNQEWKLSLIEPQAWKTHDPGVFFAECELNKDMSWSLVLSPDWQKHSTLVNAINELEQAFFNCVNDSKPIVDKLPFFKQHLSYYQRLGANALARSLKQSLEIKLGKEKSLSLAGTALVAELASVNKPLLEASIKY